MFENQKSTAKKVTITCLALLVAALVGYYVGAYTHPTTDTEPASTPDVTISTGANAQQEVILQMVTPPVSNAHEAEIVPANDKPLKLPVLVSADGVIYAENGIAMPDEEADAFFKEHRAYATVFVAVNRLYPGTNSAEHENRLESVYKLARMMPYSVEEHLDYEAVLGKISLDYPEYESDLSYLTESCGIDRVLTSYRIASDILLGKFSEFRNDGTYEWITTHDMRTYSGAEGEDVPPKNPAY